MSNNFTMQEKIVLKLMEEGYEFLNKKSNKNDDGSELISNLDVSRGYFSSAFFVAKKFGISEPVIDSILFEYINGCQKTLKMFHTINLPRELLMLDFAFLGASKASIEALSNEWAKCGSLANFKKAVKLLDRDPTKEQINFLVDDYLKGAMESKSYEDELLTLAAGFSFNLFKEVYQKINERRRRWAQMTD